MCLFNIFNEIIKIRYLVVNVIILVNFYKKFLYLNFYNFDYLYYILFNKLSIFCECRVVFFGFCMNIEGYFIKGIV